MSLRKLPSSLNGSFTTSQLKTLPAKRVASVVMCCSITFFTLEAVGKFVLFTQLGSCECQTRLWPRTIWLWACANDTIVSAPVQLNWPRVGSTVPHFISLPGVTASNWLPATLMYAWLLDRLLVAISAVPNLMLCASAAARSVVAASAG